MHIRQSAPHYSNIFKCVNKQFVFGLTGLFALGTVAYGAITATDDTTPAFGDAFWTAGGDSAGNYTNVAIGATAVSVTDAVTGMLTVDGTSSLATGTAAIGDGANTYGTATVTGAGASWTVSADPADEDDDGQITVGSDGKGALTVADNAVLTANNMYIADSSTADGTVTVATSATLTVNQTLEVGYENTATMTVQDSGEVNSFSTIVGVESGADGVLTVTDGAIFNVGVVQQGLSYQGASKFITGESGTGAMNVTDGGAVNSNTASIGLNAGAVGSVTVGDVDSAATWDVDGELTVGNEGTGTLTIENNGTVSVTEAAVFGEEGGSGSLVLNGGTLNAGTVGIESADLGGTGGAINASGVAWLVDEVTFTGSNVFTETVNNTLVTVTADGNGGLYDVNLVVQGDSEAITDPTVVTFNGVSIGDRSGSDQTALVNGEDASLLVTQYNLDIGYEGTGALTVSGGATVSADYADIGSRTGAEGTVTVTDADSTLGLTNDMSIGGSGVGTLDVLNAGDVNVGRSVYVGRDAGANGEINVTDGSLDIAADLSLGENGYGGIEIGATGVVSVVGITEIGANGGTGSINLVSGAVLNTGMLAVNGINDLEGTGTINASGVVGLIDTATFDGSNLSSENLATSYYDEDSEGTVNGTVTFNLTGDGSGSLEAVNLAVNNGADVDFKSVELGVGNGSSNSALVTGNGSRLDVDGNIVVGLNGTGALTVNNGATVTSGSNLVVGAEYGSSGAVTIDGTGTSVESEQLYLSSLGSSGVLDVTDGATFTVNGAANVGNYGGDAYVTVSDATFNINSNGGFYSRIGGDYYGELKIEAGGVVNVLGTLQLNDNTGLNPGDFYDGGRLVLDNGQLNVGTLAAPDKSASYFTGSGTIVTSGFGGMVDTLNFNNTNVYQTQIENNGTINLTLTADGAGNLYDANLIARNGAQVGFETLSIQENKFVRVQGNGTSLVLGDELFNSGEFTVDNGASVTAELVYLQGGYAVVGGTTTTLTVSETLFIYPSYGDYSAELYIEDGAVVATRSFLGYADISKEVNIEVTGAGSALNANESIELGENSGGTVHLSIRGGATVSAGTDILIGSNSVVDLTVYGNNQLNAGTDGTGGIQNDGEVNLFAYANLAAGVYTPISVGSTSGELTGTGEINAFGGAWDLAAKTFTIAALVDGSAGLVNADLGGARAEFDGGDLVVSFANGADDNANFNATEITDVASVGGFSTLQAYGFTTDMTLAVDEVVLLSFLVGEGLNAESLEFWHRDNAVSPWTLIDPDAASYADGWVNFTVTGFSDYALTIPEPQTYALIFGFLAFAAAVVRRRC